EIAKGRKSTQRERLIAGMVAAANAKGYAGASVSEVIAAARVSRPTFYDYFLDRDDCFLATLKHAQHKLAVSVEQHVRDGAPEQALGSAVGALVEFAQAEPAVARFLFYEVLAAGPRALQARDRALNELGRLIERRLSRSPAQTPAPDLPASVVLGALQRLLAVRLRRGEPAIYTLLEDLLGWLCSYELALSGHRWRKLVPGPAAAHSPFVADRPLEPPPPLPPGRPRISEEQVAENHRLRILYAAAKLSETKGYTASTVTDIARLAKVDARTFYAYFSDKQEAFLAVHEIGVQEVMRVTAEAFFATTKWPERAFDAGRTMTQYLELNPLIAQLGYVEAFAVGPAAAQRVEDSLVAFRIFLQEGYQHAHERSPARLELDAIIATFFEVFYRQSRGRSRVRLAGLLGNLSFLALAPFLGPEATNRFIDRQLPTS
ncbi:MAG: TetR/AcrR family transcriptional regulator, partial [Solirubrobacteraceae bacterium]